ncbi:MAG: GDSL-type esterase/lipase family protein [Bacteroidales bacterium]|nr:GDSL-type esterase/lipase family protein [Bacteroidales bacterium]
MKNNVLKIFAIIVTVQIVLLIYSSIFPEINVSFFNRNFKFKFLSIDDIFNFEKKKENKVADRIVSTYLQTDTSKNEKDIINLISKLPVDSLKVEKLAREILNKHLTKDSVENTRIIKDIINNYLTNDFSKPQKLLKKLLLAYLGVNLRNDFLINPEVNKIGPLDAFFNSLSNRKDTSIIRIAHYGDSQLEGDRISYYLRKRFQQKFGGSGIGFVPFMDIAKNVNLTMNNSENWMRYTVFHHRFYNSYYGLSGTVFKFRKYVLNNDSIIANIADSIGLKNYKIFPNAIIDLNLAGYVNYQNISLMYGHSLEDCIVNVYNNSTREKIYTDTLKTSESINIQKLKLPLYLQNFRLEFVCGNSPDFYGLLIDSKNGVQVDNYAIRGHSGDGLLLINSDYLARQIEMLNTKLIIFQFGANVVPYIYTDKQCEWLESVYYSLFMKFRKAAKDASILVIGAGDMATTINGEDMSYPYLPKIRDAQKNAAIKAGCAFLDLFEIMGGSNSILTWVSKRLASKDGHFSSKGQEIIGNELFNALMLEYDLFKIKPVVNNKSISSIKKNK